MVALLAIALDFLSAAVEHAVVSPGVRRQSTRRVRRTRAGNQAPAEESTAVSTSR
jgi:hypothetical protein